MRDPTTLPVRWRLLIGTLLGLMLRTAGPAWAQAQCAPPTAVTADSIVYYQAVIRWPATAGTGTCLVRVQPGNQAFTLPGTASRLRLSLSPGTAYVVEVARHCTNGLTSTPTQVAFTTPGYCGGPNDVQPGLIGTTEATILFGSAPGAVRDYTAELSTPQPNGQWQTVRTYTVSASPLQLTGLTPATLYNVVLYTNCANGVSSAGTGGPGLPFRTLALATATQAGHKSGELVVYPNPARGQCTVLIPAAAPPRGLQVQLLNAAGQVLGELEAAIRPGTAVVVPLPAVPAGLYLVRVVGPGGYVATQRLSVR